MESQESEGKKKLMSCQAMNESVQEEIKDVDDALSMGVRQSLAATETQDADADKPVAAAAAEED